MMLLLLLGVLVRLAPRRNRRWGAALFLADDQWINGAMGRAGGGIIKFFGFVVFGRVKEIYIFKGI